MNFVVEIQCNLNYFCAEVYRTKKESFDGHRTARVSVFAFIPSANFGKNSVAAFFVQFDAIECVYIVYELYESSVRNERDTSIYERISCT